MGDSLGKMIANQINNRIAMERSRLLCGNSPSGDSKHTRLYAEFGYHDTLTFNLFYDAYKRIPAAHAAITATVDKTWQDYPKIMVDEEQDQVANDLFSRLWPRFKGADRRQMVGRYGALLVQYRDSKRWDEEVDKAVVSRMGVNAIVDLIPCYEAQLQPGTTDDNEQSETYGKVLEWVYNENAVGETRSPRQFTVHHSRVIILAEGSDDGCYASGIPMLEAGFNNLINMQKVSGAAPESFFKNAARQLVYQLKEDGTLDDVVDDYNEKNGTDEGIKTVLNEIVSNLNTGFDSAAVIQNGELRALEGVVPDPKPSWEINALEFAASVRCPYRTVFGSEEGKAAGEQDGESWNTRNMSRRLWIGSIVMELINRWTELGVLKYKKYSVEWSDLLEPSLFDKLAIIEKMSMVNERETRGGYGRVFTDDEMREIADYQPLTDEQGMPPTKTEE